MRLLHRHPDDDRLREIDHAEPAREDIAGPGHLAGHRSHAAHRTAREDDATLLGATRAGDTQVVRDSDRGADSATTETRTATVRERTWTFAPGQIVSLVAGIAVVVVGVIALVRAGVDGSLSSPTVDVLGYSHTAWLGLAEIGLGLLLLLAGTGAWGRPLSVLLGAASVVAGVLVLAEPDQMPDELGLEKGYGWPLIALGAIVALAAMALPVWRRRHVRDDDLIDLRGSST